MSIISAWGLDFRVRALRPRPAGLAGHVLAEDEPLLLLDYLPAAISPLNRQDYGSVLGRWPNAQYHVSLPQIFELLPDDILVVQECRRRKRRGAGLVGKRLRVDGVERGVEGLTVYCHEEAL